MENKPKYYNDVRNRSSQKYNAAHLEDIKFRARKEERLNDRITLAASLRNVSKAAYIHDAICASLDADGVTIDALTGDLTDSST